MTPTSSLLIAQAAQDISSVPAEFVKFFFMMVGFAGALWGGVTIGRRGSKASPLHVEQPVSVDASVTHAPVYAPMSALEALKKDIDARTRENLRQHEDNREQMAAVIAAGNDRLQSMLTALHEMETRMTTATLKEIKSLHDRMNPIAEATARHNAQIEAQAGRTQHLWEMIQTLWAQVFRKAPPRG